MATHDHNHDVDDLGTFGAGVVMLLSGTLQPGVLTDRLVLTWRDPDAVVTAARTVTDTSHASRLMAGRLVDWFTRLHAPTLVPNAGPLPYVPTWHPVRVAVLAALARALGGCNTWLLDQQAAEASRLTREGLGNAEIVERMGLNDDRKLRRLRERAAEMTPKVRLWPDADAVIADVNAGLDDGDKEVFLDGVVWFADRERPLPYGMWLAALRALRLGAALPERLDADSIQMSADELMVAVAARVDQIDAEIERLRDRRGAKAKRRPAASPNWLYRHNAEADMRGALRRAAAVEREIERYGGEPDEEFLKGLHKTWCVFRDGLRWLVETRTPLPHDIWRAAVDFAGIVPTPSNTGLTRETVIALSGQGEPDAYVTAARLVGEARAIYPADVAFTGVEPLTVKGLADRIGVTPATVYEWLENDDRWQAACWPHEIMARQRGRALARKEAARLVGIARAGYPAGDAFEGIEPLAIEEIVNADAVKAHAYVDAATVARWIADKARWSRSCATEEMAERQRQGEGDCALYLPDADGVLRLSAQ